jgi:hypothetical protein
MTAIADHAWCKWQRNAQKELLFGADAVSEHRMWREEACNAITFANMTLSQAPRFERIVLA